MTNAPVIPANLADLSGDAWQDLADDVAEYEASIMTDAQRAFMKLHKQHAQGLLTDTDFWAETCEIVLANKDSLFPASEVAEIINRADETRTLVGHGPTATYRITDAQGKFIGYSARP